MSADERLDELAREHGLSPPTTSALSALLALLAEDGAAPTTVREPARAVDVHIADSLSALALDEVRAARRIADLGAGAGLPGLVLAAALPRAEVRLVESLSRKCRFLERAVDAMGLANAAVVCRRAESWPEGLGTHDLVTARALAPLGVILEYAAPLLAIGGAAVAWKGQVGEEEAGAAARAAPELGLEPRETRRVEPWFGAERHTLHLYLKVGQTPARFPRREGMARKRPLGGSTST